MNPRSNYLFAGQKPHWSKTMKKNDKPDFRFAMNGMHASDGERGWYIPGEEMNELSHKLRYGKPDKIDFLKASSIIQQFSSLICSEEIYGDAGFRKNSIKFCRDAMKARTHDKNINRDPSLEADAMEASNEA